MDGLKNHIFCSISHFPKFRVTKLPKYGHWTHLSSDCKMNALRTEQPTIGNIERQYVIEVLYITIAFASDACWRRGRASTVQRFGSPTGQLGDQDEISWADAHSAHYSGELAHSSHSSSLAIACCLPVVIYLVVWSNLYCRINLMRND